MKMGSNKSMQDWGDAGAKTGKDDDNFGNWGGHVVKDLIDPGKKDKDRIDEDPNDKPTGGKDAVKGENCCFYFQHWNEIIIILLNIIN